MKTTRELLSNYLSDFDIDDKSKELMNNGFIHGMSAMFDVMLDIKNSLNKENQEELFKKISDPITINENHIDDVSFGFGYINGIGSMLIKAAYALDKGEDLSFEKASEMAMIKDMGGKLDEEQ